MVMLLPLMAACSDDESADPYDINYVYIYSPVRTDNTLEYKGNGTFLVEIAPECIVNPVRCTKPAPADLTIRLDIDPSLVDSYNQTNGTNYTLLKSAQLENATLQIKKGEYISVDSLKVHYTDMAEFQNGAENYLLPISITSVKGSSVSVSENSRIYLTFSSSYKANYVTMGSSQTISLEYENGAFNNLSERVELENMLTSSWAADEDINVSLKIDPSLIDAYNAINGTNYILMPKSTFEDATLTIKKGSKTPDRPVTLIFSDAMASVELGKGYILPITITDVNGIGAEAGKTLSTYVIFNIIEKMTISAEDAPVGTAINDFSIWNIAVDGKTEVSSTKSWMDLVNKPGNWISKLSALNIMDVDMGKLEKISSIQMGYYTVTYSVSSISIATSTDGMSYKVGQCAMATAKKHNYVLQYPTEARYIRIIFSGAGTYGTYPTALSVYTAD